MPTMNQVEWLWYHGTTIYGFREILQDGKLRKGTYFTPYLDSAISMGGEYVIAVLLNMDPQKSYWEWVSNRDITEEEIHSVRKFKVSLLSYNPKLQTRLQWGTEDYCQTCQGHGELNYPEDGHHLLPGGSSFRTSRVVEVCPDCEGYGQK